MERQGSGARPRLRLRATASSLVTLPWGEPLASWSLPTPDLDVQLGASRHVVRVVRGGDRLWALKELPRWAAEREHAALVTMEHRGVPAVRPAGLVTSGPVTSDGDGDAVLITEYLSDSVLWRTLLEDLPGSADRHRSRLSEAVAVFLVELHRRGVFWGDCSLANLLFRRDGEVLQPFLVDAETAEVHASLTAGQRRHDLEILQDNLAGGLLDLAAEQDRTVDVAHLARQTAAVAAGYDRLWASLHGRPTVPLARRQDAVEEVRRLNDLGYAVDEVRLTSSAGTGHGVRLETVVAHRRHHAAELQRLTGIEAGEGQARVLLGDLRSHAEALPGLTESDAARSWVEQVLRPAVERLVAAREGTRDPVQDYCDLLEVRWLLSERAGRDVGDDVAVAVLAGGGVPAGAAAELDLSGRASWRRSPPAQERRHTAPPG